jgi:hypothetical protein
MIVSVHLPKTAGNSLRGALELEFKDRLLQDYDDWAGYRSPESDLRAARNKALMQARRDELMAKYDLIHGHFVADKYVALFPETNFLAFFRDPFQQTVSQYEFLLRIPHVRQDHPAVAHLHDNALTLEEFIVWEATKNPQTQCIGGLTVEDFAMVGLVEEYPRSIALFEATFRRRIASDIFANCNPRRHPCGYKISADLRRLIERHRAADIELYHRAKALFARQTRRHGL